ncbi:KAP family P-loop NTPase fold protein [Pseudomonas fluorescens]|uniref:KAP family P-loop NTPase fold protein n=1 Tax=Pseudomonas fluorescens TaxID=294 RepID=UPI001BE50D88|nr:P-loop NTPase fold protein [Pseudomonas fluorescens]MBT2372863.1 hypothetical protein [Pseudomonas fluorescens]
MLGQIYSYLHHPFLGYLDVLNDVYTAPISSTGGFDAPASGREEDELNRWSLSKSVLRAIENTSDDWSIRIALYGKWGTGKTSVLNFIETQINEQNQHISPELDSTKVVIVRFSAWNAAGEDGVINQFYNALLDQLPTQKKAYPVFFRLGKRLFQRVLRVIKTLWAAVAACFGSTGEPVTVGTIAAMRKTLDKVTAWSAFNKKDLARLQHELDGYRVVVFIDDLDRADPTIIPKTMLALRELLDWPKFAFVLAFDLDIISAALGDYSRIYGQDARRFLEKIIDLQLTLPDPTEREKEAMGRNLFEIHCDFIPQGAIEDVIRWLPGNPRLAKVIVRELALLKTVALRHDTGELNWKAIVLQTILKHEAPKTFEVVNSQLLGREQIAVQMTFDNVTREQRAAAVKAAVTLSFDKELGEKAPGYQSLENKVLALQMLRQHDFKQRIKYETDLLTKEPSITLREYTAFLEQWLSTPDDRLVNALLKLGTEASHDAVDNVARRLFVISMLCCSEAIASAAREGDRSIHNRLVQQTQEHLQLLEYLWHRCSVPVIQIVSERFSLWREVALFATKAHESEGELENEALLCRIDQLVQEAAKKCESSVQVCDYGQAIRQESKKNIGSVRTRTLALFEVICISMDAGAVQDILLCFGLQGAIEKAYTDTSEKNQMRRLRLTELSSPLYAEEGLKALCEAFDISSLEHSHQLIFAANIVSYLDRLRWQWIQTSGPEDNGALQEVLARLVPSAWNSVLTVERGSRRPQVLIKKRDYLISGGFLEEWLSPVLQES